MASEDEKCWHGRRICVDCVIVGDPAKRAFDIARSYAVFTPWDELIRSWIAFRLSDGGSDGTLYGSRAEAIRHQAHEMQCAYFSYRNAPNGFKSPKDAALYLEFHRAAYDRGMRLVDPDGPELMMPLTNEDFLNQRARLIAG